MEIESLQPHSKRSALQQGRQILKRRKEIELVTDAWNYFPHKVLGGISPAEMLLRYQNK